MRNLLFLLILFCGCSQLLPTPAPKIDEDDAKAKASVSILLTDLTKDSQPSPQPDNAPKPGDKCPTCKGTGKTGDGRVGGTCMDCNGTGKVLVKVITFGPSESDETKAEIVKEELIDASKILPEPQKIDDKPFKPADEKKQEVIKKKLVVYVAPWCDACHKWLEKRSKNFTDLGVEIITMNYDDQEKPVILPGGKVVERLPTFVYYENDVPVKWFIGDLTVDFVKAQGIKL